MAKKKKTKKKASKIAKKLSAKKLAKIKAKKARAKEKLKAKKAKLKAKATEKVKAVKAVKEVKIPKAPKASAQSKIFDLTIILDRSGSMVDIKDDMEGGLREHIEDQKKEKGVDIKVSYCTFDDTHEVHFTAKNIADVKTEELILTPRGSTALLDTVGRMIVETKARIDALPADQKPIKVSFMIITDGHENASKEYNRDKLKELVEERKNQDKWEFIFLGANIDAFSTGSALGFTSNVNYKTTSAGTKGMFKAMTNARSAVYSAVASSSIDDLHSMDLSATIDDAAVLKEEENELKKEKAEKTKKGK
jgi:hypothetical protein